MESDSTDFVENYSNLPQRYLRNEYIFKVLAVLFPKINHFTCYKMFNFFSNGNDIFFRFVSAFKLVYFSDLLGFKVCIFF